MADDIHEQVQQRFGEAAQRYVNSAVHGTGYSLDRLVELMIEVAPPQSGHRFLDVATGGGHVARALATALTGTELTSPGAHVIASDLTMPMLQAARASINESGENAENRLPVDYVRADAQHLPFRNGALDGVTCRLAAHHFPDVAGFVSECARVIRDGGIVGLVDQIGPAENKAARYVNAFEKLRDPSHVWEYSQDDWLAYMNTTGLRVRQHEIARTRLDFAWWTRMQNNDADTILRLRVMLKQAPQAVLDFLEPEYSPDGAISFSLWQVILVAEKG